MSFVFKNRLLCVFFLICGCFGDGRISDSKLVEIKILKELTESAAAQAAFIAATEKAVYANQDWQNTGFSVNAGQSAVLSAKGTWYMTNSQTAIPPEGLKENPSFFGLDYRIDKDFNHGQLLCRINSSPQLRFSVGALNPTASGNLECRINDNDLANNGGDLKVTLK